MGDFGGKNAFLHVFECRPKPERTLGKEKQAGSGMGGNEWRGLLLLLLLLILQRRFVSVVLFFGGDNNTQHRVCTDVVVAQV